MTAMKRIIACLDVKNGRVVKGVSFKNVRDAGDPVELAALYEREGADELIFLDISATAEGRQTTLDAVREIADRVHLPFTVGGGIASVTDMERLLQAGADKISIGTAAVKRPELITAGSQEFGRERIVVGIDAKFDPSQRDWFVYTHGGWQPTKWRAREWAKRVAELGAGEILLTSMDRDGHKSGFDLELTREIAMVVSIPVIASGGAGRSEHFVDVLTAGQADAALAASIFHYQEVSIRDVKATLEQKGVPVRW